MLQNSVQARSAFYVCTVNHQHRNTQRTERTFNILLFRVRVSICLFHFIYCQVFWVFKGSGSGFPGFRTCQLFTWPSFLQSQITHKNVSVLSCSHLRDMLLTLSFQKSKILLICLRKIRPVRCLDPWTCLVSLGPGSTLGEKGNKSAWATKKISERIEPRQEPITRSV